jgi:hypothetical protein
MLLSGVSMKRMLLSALVVCCALLLGGCWNGRVLFAMEEPYWMAAGGDALLRWPLVRASVARGYLPRFLVIGAQQDPEGSFSRSIRAGRYRAVVVGPLLSLEPLGFAPAQTRFLLLDDPTTPQQNNAVRLVFDRIASFKTAGYAAGLSVGAETGGNVSNALSSHIGILVSAHPPGTSEELAAFSSGVEQALDGGQPLVRTLSEPSDRNSMKAAIDQMRSDGVEIFLLFTGNPDSWALENLRNAGGCAIVSNWAASNAFPQQVFLSIEADLSGGVARFLSNREAGPGTVSGPVRLVAGKARSIPALVASQVVLK